MAAYKVSVVIPVYNGAEYLKESVLSAINLAETGEVLLIDDASTDDSLVVCRQLEKKFDNVFVFTHPDKKNHGAAASRNIGISNAQFDYLSFLDADDYYLPNRFTYEQKIFLKYPDANGVYGCTQAVFTNELARKKFLERYKDERTTTTKELQPKELFMSLLFGGYGRFHTSGITLHKAAFKKAGLFNPAIRQVEDTDFWLRLSLKAQLYAGSINEAVSIRRVHDNNSIHNHDYVSIRSKEMYQRLFDWSLNEPFSFEVKNAFFIVLHKFVKGEDYDVKKLFWQLVMQRPSVIFSSFFLKKIHQIYLPKL